MKHFEFIANPISILIGLSVAQLLTGICGMVRDVDKVRFFYPHVALVLLAVIVQLQYWWQMWMWKRDTGSWGIVIFFITMLHPMVLYLLATLAFPVPGDPTLLVGGKLDVETYYFRVHQLTFALVTAIPFLYMLTDYLLGTFNRIKVLFRIGFMLIFTQMAAFSSRTLHYVFTTIAVVAFLVFISCVDNSVPSLAE